MSFVYWIIAVALAAAIWAGGEGSNVLFAEVGKRLSFQTGIVPVGAKISAPGPSLEPRQRRYSVAHGDSRGLRLLQSALQPQRGGIVRLGRCRPCRGSSISRLLHYPMALAMGLDIGF